jgi:hypothetical protein
MNGLGEDSKQLAVSSEQLRRECLLLTVYCSLPEKGVAV